MYAGKDSRLGVAVRHRDPLLAMGLEEALRREADIDLLDAASERTAAPPQVVVTDYQTALDMVVRGPKPALHLAEGPRIMVVTSNDREQDVRQALEQGVDGYLLLGGPVEEIVDGVRALGQGRRYVCSMSACRLAESLARDRLTRRETDVLALLALGISDKMIARQLGITPGTVKHHVRAILEKLGARCRTEAARVAIQRGLIEWCDPHQLPSRPTRPMPSPEDGQSQWPAVHRQQPLAA